MIVKEYLDNGKFIRYFSDEDFKIQKLGTDEIYSDAVELVDTEVEYIETDEKIPKLDINENIVRGE